MSINLLIPQLDRRLEDERVSSDLVDEVLGGVVGGIDNGPHLDAHILPFIADRHGETLFPDILPLRQPDVDRFDPLNVISEPEDPRAGDRDHLLLALPEELEVSGVPHISGQLDLDLLGGQIHNQEVGVLFADDQPAIGFAVLETGSDVLADRDVHVEEGRLRVDFFPVKLVLDPQEVAVEFVGVDAVCELVLVDWGLLTVHLIRIFDDLDAFAGGRHQEAGRVFEC